MPFVSFTVTMYFVSVTSPGSSILPSPSLSLPSSSFVSVTEESPLSSVISSESAGNTTTPFLSVTPFKVLGSTTVSGAVVSSLFSGSTASPSVTSSFAVSSFSGSAIVSVTVTFTSFTGVLSALFATVTVILLS